MAHQTALAALALICALALPASAEPGTHWAFESGQVRPLALSPDGKWLFAVNTPDARLEVFRVVLGYLLPWGSVPVGLEPVAVAARTNHEVWVVNRLSDSVSVVDVSHPPGRVVRTLHVGDDPQDVVFAGPGRKLGFVTSAHRGQNSPWPRSEFATPGVGRADVWVFDATSLGSSLGGDPRTVLTLFGDRPRALAASPDGSRVYAGVFRSGNRSTVVTRPFLCPGGAQAAPCEVGGATAPGGLPSPNANVEGVPAPREGLVVLQDPASGEWLDELGRDWSALVRFELPDLDVFEIDALADPPREVAAFPGVGTVLFNMAVNPATGSLYVSNTEAHNEVRFEGPGTLAAGEKPPGEPASVRGHLHEARITRIDASGVLPLHLNPHIPYEVSPVPAGVKQRSLATPLGMAVSGDGRKLFVAAFGSGKVGVLDAEALEEGDVELLDSIQLEGGGPTGLVLRGRQLFVLTRFDNAIEVVDLRRQRTMQRVSLHDTEPASVVDGRPFLYDATQTSSNGEASCSACHVFGDTDDLAWDLGNPDALLAPNPNEPVDSRPLPDFHPMKGPMGTQTLRGMAKHGPMHWRGDRTGGAALPSPDAERVAFEAFNVAFGGLIGRDEGELPPEQMRAFAEFALQLVPPPNPIASLDGSLRPDEARGRDIFFNKPSTASVDAGGGLTLRTCNSCHELDPLAGHFGTNALSGQGDEQVFKVPQLRTLYQKIGMFGLPDLPGFSFTDPGPMGAQVRGFGFSHHAGMDTVFRFLSSEAFVLSEAEEADLEAFLVGFPSRLAPVVGQQLTLTAASSAEALARAALLMERAGVPHPIDRLPTATECDLVAKGRVEGRARGFLLTASGRFRSDRAEEPELDPEALRSLALIDGQELTFTCAPPGSGLRLAIDRDEDGFLDADERDAGSDPADAESVPGERHFPICGRGFELAVLVPVWVLGRRRRPRAERHAGSRPWTPFE